MDDHQLVAGGGHKAAANGHKAAAGGVLGMFEGVVGSEDGSCVECNDDGDDGVECDGDEDEGMAEAWEGGQRVGMREAGQRQQEGKLGCSPLFSQQEG